ncbi:hypothetical protein [Chitinophaga sancti]|uniref:hypothetical protein n=1 Tax=Chitinophaga sancti TaxID=1004 RepID=UPI001C435C41|nr:hypothetical protein [Chitinophaga sancti]
MERLRSVLGGACEWFGGLRKMKKLETLLGEDFDGLGKAEKDEVVRKKARKVLTRSVVIE